MMYHSHHNATDQVGRGLLGAFVVDPKEPDRASTSSTASTSGSRTTCSAASPSTATASRRSLPIVAAVGETVRIRYMNEGIMYHPFHSHGYKQTVVARDGYPLGSRRLRRGHGDASAPASAGTSTSWPTASACGRSTATSSPTSRARTACSAWSTC